MDKNQGYEIIKAIMLENGRGFALGYHPTAPSPYVTWACYDDDKGQRQSEWGHYGIMIRMVDKSALTVKIGLPRQIMRRTMRHRMCSGGQPKSTRLG